MYEDDTLVANFRKTLKQVIKDLESLQGIPKEDFEIAVKEQFERYSYEGEEEVVGFEQWPLLEDNSNYELLCKIDHEYAYECTLFVTIKENLCSVTNVL